MRPGCRWVHPGSLRSLAYDHGVVGFIRDRWVLSSLRSSRVVGFTWVRSGGRRVHPCSLWVVGYIRDN